MPITVMIPSAPACVVAVGGRDLVNNPG